MTRRKLAILLLVVFPTLAWGATGSISLIDSSGFEYFINTSITFSTSSSASGAISEASYTTGVNATTATGGTATSTLTDAFDGYNTVCVGTAGDTAFCSTGNADQTIYNNNGAATTECSGRQVVLNPQTIGNLEVSRKVFVPDDDDFARWLNIVTNNDTSTETVTLVIANNLGSDSNTVIVDSSSGNAAAEVGDRWVTTFQDFSGSTSTDPRLGHVLRGTGGAVGLAAISFADGDDDPSWAYTFDLGAGETAIIMNFVTGQPSKAAAGTKADSLSNLEGSALNCMSVTEHSQVINFDTSGGGGSPTVTPTPTVTETPVPAPTATRTPRRGGGGGGGCDISPDGAGGSTLPLGLLAGLLFAGWLRRRQTT